MSYLDCGVDVDEKLNNLRLQGALAPLDGMLDELDPLEICTLRKMLEDMIAGITVPADGVPPEALVAVHKILGEKITNFSMNTYEEARSNDEDNACSSW